MRKAIRKHRGDRTAIVARIPDVMVERIDEERAKYGATRVDYVWSVLAQYFEMTDLDPLTEDKDEDPQLALTPAGPKPNSSRAA